MFGTISLRGTACLWVVLSLLGCGDDAEGDQIVGGPEGPSYLGSCNFPASFTCSDYGHPQATADSESTCASSGGTWSAAQCPIAERWAVCTATLPSTRTYAYSVEAAATMEGTCPMGSFNRLKTPMAGEGGAGGSAGAAGAAGAAGSAGSGGSAGGDEDAGT
jgi:hypothetical protein